MTNIQKCGVIGVGFVGATCAYTLAVSGLFSDLVLVDMNRDKAIGEAADINHGVAFSKPCRVMAGDYADLAECGLIIIAAGANQKPGESRLELLGRNKGILSSVIAQLTAVNREAILLVVSNPVDIMTYLVWKFSGLSASQVIGSGTALDTARLCCSLASMYDLDSKSVHAYILGEHGDSEMVAWSSSTIGGKLLSDVLSDNAERTQNETEESLLEQTKQAGWEIFSRKGNTCYGIAASTTAIVKSILFNENRILPVSVLVNGIYGIENVYLSVPTILNGSGAKETVEIRLDEKEKKALLESAALLKSIYTDLQV